MYYTQASLSVRNVPLLYGLVIGTIFTWPDNGYGPKKRPECIWICDVIKTWLGLSLSLFPVFRLLMMSSNIEFSVESGSKMKGGKKSYSFN